MTIQKILVFTVVLSIAFSIYQFCKIKKYEETIEQLNFKKTAKDICIFITESNNCNSQSYEFMFQELTNKINSAMPINREKLTRYTCYVLSCEASICRSMVPNELSRRYNLIAIRNKIK